MAQRENSPVEDTTDRTIISSRLFAAPRESVFQAFSDPAQLARWWGPEGFTNEFHEFALRAGGRWRFTMRGPDGTAYPMHHEFVEITPPARIVFDHLQPGHDFRLTMTFAVEGRGCRLTWRMGFASANECARVRPLVVAGNEQNFDRLAAHLSQSIAKP